MAGESDRDLLIRIDESLNGKGGIKEQLKDFKLKSSQVTAVAHDARRDAQTALEATKRNETRLNKMSGGNAIFTFLAALGAALAGYFGKGHT